ncbi:two-component sensor histidine kinase [Mangrovactinospora gilvigrisea]|uniref:Signal transduction histidine-protein kinase/phosphatase MprB n=2 Tax=Mangrovactinospora gilvigrisea TaxID=1428644 RepID=A0A1J7BYQ4_9ACTN|nr:two-component sensor histidine kinase [Mangrovactinospora gilvigrisea]
MINSTLAVVLVVVAVFGIPLAVVEVNSITSNARDQVTADAVRLLTVVETRGGGDLDASSLEAQIGEDRTAWVRTPGRPAERIGPAVPAGTSVFKDTEQGTQGVSVTVVQPQSTVHKQIYDILLVIVGIAAAAVAAAVVLAVRQANRLSGPLVDLAKTAERLGSGDATPRDRRYAVPELDRVSQVLDASAERIARMLTAERRLAADASHQLRTPLTALSMRLEEIIETAGDEETVKEEASIALGQVERLTDVVQRLLTNSRDHRGDTGIAFDLDDVIKQQMEEWRPAAAAAGRALEREGQGRLRVVGTPGTIAQVLAALIENALMHGDGTVVLRTRTAGNSVVLEVSDEGDGVSPELGSRVFERAVSGRNSTGLGLAVARDLAEADGGRLELVSMRPPVFAMFLSRQPDSEPEPDPETEADASTATSEPEPGTGPGGAPRGGSGPRA